MPSKPDFTPEQQAVIRATARKVWKKQFEWMKKTTDRPGGQEAMALALGVSQQTVSNLIDPREKYSPGRKVASNLANLDGQTLEQLLKEYAYEEPPSRGTREKEADPFANLTICIQFHASTKHWSAWTVAAAKAGFFGNADFPAPEWTAKLDALEKALERVRKTV